MAGQVVPSAIVPTSAPECRTRHRGESRRSPAPAAMDRFAPLQSTRRPAAWQRLLTDGENFGGEVSLHRALTYRQRSGLFRLDVRGLDDRPPLRNLSFLMLSKCIGALLVRCRNISSEFGKALSGCRVGKQNTNLGV